MLLGNRRVAMHPTPVIDGLQTSPEAVLGRLSRERPSAFPRDSPVVGESQEVEGARWLESVGVILPGPPAICRLAEADETLFSGCIVKPKRSRRFGSTSRTRWASGSCSMMMTTSSA